MGLRTFTFAGTSSSTYSMFITEAATYNVPERAVEMLEVPGRNGYFALDQGRFENVEVTYHVVVHKDTNANFQTELSNVRNWLASKVGYQRLTDDYNSNVYRMAIFKGGLETEEAFVNGAEFDIVFECKPQRWLTSGETAVSITSGGTITNPTLFDAPPLLLTEGYGDITINDSTISVDNVPVGDVLVSGDITTKNVTLGRDIICTQNFRNLDLLNVGDTITCTRLHIQAYIMIGSSYSSISVTNVSGGTVNASMTSRGFSLDFIVEGSSATWDGTTTGNILNLSARVTATTSGGQTVVRDVRLYGGAIVDGRAKPVIEIPAAGETGSVLTRAYSNTYYGDSTKSALGHPMYVDLDLGEAFNNDTGTMFPVNDSLSLPPELPVLNPGGNTITYDNTFTDFKVVPRWWKV